MGTVLLDPLGSVSLALLHFSKETQKSGDNWEEAGKQFVSVNPKKRFGKPEEVARLVAFLLSGESEFINGAVIPIDGGQSAQY